LKAVSTLCSLSKVLTSEESPKLSSFIMSWRRTQPVVASVVLKV
jgi:hypothetical protein